MSHLNKPGSTLPPQSWPTWIRCQECETEIVAAGAGIIILAYLFGQSAPFHPFPSCPRCQARLDFWRVALGMIKRNFGRLEPFFLLGAHLTRFQTKVFQDQITEFDLFAEGLPKEALILNVNMHGDGMFCGEASGSDRILRRAGGLLRIHGYHMSHSPEPRATEGRANIDVTWVSASLDDSAWGSLVLAFNNYVADDYEASIIPANVAVESRLFRFLGHHLSRVSTTDRVNEFLKSYATYSHQLNILLPLVASYLGIPELTDDVRGKLNRLNRLRHSLAHEGRCSPPLNKDDCAELIVASLFAFRYLGLSQRRSVMLQLELINVLRLSLIHAEH